MRGCRLGQSNSGKQTQYLYANRGASSRQVCILFLIIHAREKLVIAVRNVVTAINLLTDMVWRPLNLTCSELGCEAVRASRSDKEEQICGVSEVVESHVWSTDSPCLQRNTGTAIF